ncbi:phagocyte signaling impaired isoform X2 [Tachypleus tridentatus]|uniref:phagocyte signaling impaired isoform X2 n=1 Tax=Tachypleus tridentatus TaxID=6853 RepID=UPI003FCFE57D
MSQEENQEMSTDDNMAARSTDSSVNERRLRPIYDCLDNGNNKKALQEAEKLLKKQKDFQCAKVLKALALIRLGRQDESLSTLKEVHQEGPTDDATLQAMTICYRELQKPELIADIYETAVKKEPQNEELYSHLFMAYVRLGNYKKQQQTAMVLYKLKPKNPYYFWAVMSIVMQACSSNENLAKTMYLPLAERMTKKFVQEDKIEAEAEVQLYLMILNLQDKFEEALDVLDGPLGEKVVSHLDVLPRKRAELLTKLERWPEVNSTYKKLIMTSPDQWSYYIEYFNSVAKLADLEWRPDEDSSLDPPVDYTFDMAAEFILTLLKTQRDHPALLDHFRGPHLAKLELAFWIRHRENSSTSALGNIIDLLLAYFEKFGAKGSCFLDMVRVVDSFSLTEEEKLQVLERIKFSLSSNGKEVKLPDNVKEMQRHLCYVQLCHYFGHHENYSKEDKLKLAICLYERYTHGLQFGKDLLSTDFKPSDNYALLAAHILIDIWEEKEDEKFLIEALVMLETALKNSPSNFQIKLLLLNLYNIIGAVGASHTLYESLDIKHVQQETLGYLITSHLAACAHFSVASTVLTTALRFFNSNFKDIQQIVEFREKLNNSVQYTSIAIERNILDVLLETKSHQTAKFVIGLMEVDPEKDKIEWDKLSDNRDLALFRMWNSKHVKAMEDLKSVSLQEQVKWIKLRYLIVRAVKAAFDLTKSQAESNHSEISNGEKRGVQEVLEELLTLLKEYLGNIDSEILTYRQVPVQAPAPTRLKYYLQGRYLQVLVSLLEYLLYLQQLLEGSQSSQTKLEQLKNTVMESLQGIFLRVQLETLSRTAEKKVESMRKTLEELVNAVETLSLSMVLVNIGHTLLKPAKLLHTKKGKKKKDLGLSIGLDTFQSFNELVAGMEQAASSLQQMLQQLDVTLVGANLEATALNEPEGDQEVVKDIREKINKSYQVSVRELNDIFYTKIKYIQTLKLW